MVFALRAAPAQRLDLSPLVPQNLGAKTASEIAAIELQTTRERVTVGDVFRVRDGDRSAIVVEGASGRFDRVGMALSAGDIVVEGDVGAQAGRQMTGGRLTVRGNAGRFSPHRG